MLYAHTRFVYTCTHFSSSLGFLSSSSSSSICPSSSDDTASFAASLSFNDMVPEQPEEDNVAKPENVGKNTEVSEKHNYGNIRPLNRRPEIYDL